MRPLTAEDIASRRLLVRQRHAELMKQQEEQQKSTTCTTSTAESQGQAISTSTTESEQQQQEPVKEEENHVFIAFARVFSGKLRKGQQLYVLGPKYDPSSRTSDDIDEKLLLKVIF